MHFSVTDSSLSDSDDTKTMKFKIPEVNFYNSLPNAVGVVGQGFLWIRELSASIGTPIVIYVMTIPMLALGVGLIFIPDFTQAGIPGFYGQFNSVQLHF